VLVSHRLLDESVRHRAGATCPGAVGPVVAGSVGQGIQVTGDWIVVGLGVGNAASFRVRTTVDMGGTVSVPARRRGGNDPQPRSAEIVVAP
jgi:hypothetical protein